MIPKRDSEGFAIDYYSNDIEGAADFQRHYNGHLLSGHDSEWDGEEGDGESEDNWDDFYDCGCSDPGCPCGGRKTRAL